MSDPVRAIADAVLYEGYLLWPYRRSSPKNQQRFNFGCVVAPAWHDVHPDERSAISTQCLLEAADAELDIRARFLHVVHRQVLDERGAAVDEWTDADGVQHLTWDEAVEREVTPGRFNIHAGSELERLPGGGGLLRNWRTIAGELRVSRDVVANHVTRISVWLANHTLSTPYSDRAAALRQTLCSTHIVMRAPEGGFVSPLDERSTAWCHHEQLWPVLVGTAPDRSTLLASALLLDEYPQIAPESAGDLFDGGEVDQLLTLNILGMTDAEKDEMRATDPRARAILERTEAMTAKDLMRMHGTVRDLESLVRG